MERYNTTAPMLVAPLSQRSHHSIGGTNGTSSPLTFTRVLVCFVLLCQHAAPFLVRKTSFSANQRFVFIAGVEGCGHHYWSSAFNEVCRRFPEVQAVQWAGASPRTLAWGRCAKFGHGALDAHASTCVQHVVGYGDNSTIFASTGGAKRLLSAYSASVRSFSRQINDRQEQSTRRRLAGDASERPLLEHGNGGERAAVGSRRTRNVSRASRTPQPRGGEANGGRDGGGMRLRHSPNSSRSSSSSRLGKRASAQAVRKPAASLGVTVARCQ